jgi:hypothetical protein
MSFSSENAWLVTSRFSAAPQGQLSRLEQTNGRFWASQRPSDDSPTAKRRYASPLRTQAVVLALDASGGAQSPA